MNIAIYAIIVAVLCLIVFAYYYLQKNKVQDIEKIYSNYLLTHTTPDIAFTYAQNPDGTYTNYHLNFDADNPKLLTSEVSNYPVVGTGESYKPTTHGTVTENKTGFRISNVDAVFECPENWEWNSDKKTCELVPICRVEDDQKLKGIDQYYFNLNVVQNRIDKKETAPATVHYHDRLYVKCLNKFNDYTIESCTHADEARKIFNQRKIQPNIQACEWYDVCSDFRNYALHHFYIGNYDILDDNEYYMCIDSKSIKQTCPENSVFNIPMGGCVEENRCNDKDNGFTFFKDDTSYAVCVDGVDAIVNCMDGVYTANGNEHLACNVDKSDSYVSFFTNKYIVFPIGLYTYNDNNKKLNMATIGNFTREMELAKDTSTFFKNPRNSILYESCMFSSYFIEYIDENTKEDSQSVLLDIDNYKKFSNSPNVVVSYYKDALLTITWNIIEDRPANFKKDEVYYKYNTIIKHRNDSTVTLDASLYFFFNVAEELYSPNMSYFSQSKVDTDTGILGFVEFKIPKTVKTTDPILSSAFRVFSMTEITEDVTILYYLNCFDNTLNAMACNSKTIAKDSFTIASDGITSFLFNYPEWVASDTDYYVRLSSIMWTGYTISAVNYVVPELFAIFQILSLEELDKQFNLLDPEPLTGSTTLAEYRIKIESKYNKNIPFTGNSADLIDIQTKLSDKFLNVGHL
ncbi:Vp91 [Homarus gammarus nudivirus]|uniref:Vp91 n=1 Tax=Homarus gammarus nudivirus TaxID=2509616 RepID=A0A411HB29_9VIRU|nr:Vp91 [Homarus gammarus nudivirus]QBB28610.1 Vp91 [Homarus gammarus nudivirus]